MLKFIIALFLIVPIIEIWGLITVGQWIGTWPTVIVVVLTAVAGAIFAKTEGLKTMRLIQLQLSRGEMPGNAIIDGACILIGGVLLMAPGFFTDLFGLLFLIPYSRSFVKLWFKHWLLKRLREGKTIVIRRF